MDWLLLATIFGAVHTQPLFFRPHESRENQKDICCSDGTCCPPGETCGQIPGQCIGGGDVLTSLVSATLSDQPNYVYCPGSQTICADGNTCCKRPGGGVLCCRYVHAVCCDDGRHCCPFGQRCLQGGGCTGGAVDESWSLMRPALNRNKVPCDETHQCPVGHTCCKGQTGGWKCCPWPNAVCCGDKSHCCPQRMKCGAKTCTKSDSPVDLFLKTPARRTEGVICPDGRSECQDGQTCCKLSSGSWACCPLPKAVCCSDGLHCCPQGKTCSVSTGTCNNGDLQIDWVKKTPARKLHVVPCPGGQFVCPDNTKCCSIPSGGYRCCNFADGVCCSDGKHCCPRGSRCSAGKCVKDGVKGDSFVDIFVKTPAVQLTNSVCPDGKLECQDNSTCCQLPSGDWGCCPLP